MLLLHHPFHSSLDEWHGFQVVSSLNFCWTSGISPAALLFNYLMALLLLHQFSLLEMLFLHQMEKS